ncbi:VOC family protein [Pseudoduganella flava]|uniref:VOC family protein n=1 Tax=Pseudoduganella flava TaxID=871742 RepID=UPI001E2BC108|nr:VOC family protein [Pseudoduganella flava]
MTILLSASITAAAAEPTGHVTGIGGIFFKAQDPKALAKWYRDTLGLPLQPWSGALLRYDAPDHPPKLTWQAFPASTTYFAPSTNTFMINFAVDDMEALLARLATRGVMPLKRSDDDPNGKFAWILDPEGNKVELWEPKRATP